MVFEHIEKLKRDYTDKYVLVDDSRPELARFKDTPGRVKTVNMSGRALVEFDAYANIGWYDIDVDYLKVIDRPVPKEPEKKAAPTKKPAAAKAAATPAATGKKLSPLEMARMQGAAGGKGKEATQEAKPAAAKPQGKPSTADILAAARGGTSAAAPPAAAKETPAAKDPAAMSVADKIAMLRGEKGAVTAAEAKTEAAPPGDAPDESAAEATEEAVAETPTATPTEAVDRASMSVADIIAWCRQHDAS
ncbi:MAG: hypothetical protein OES79_08145 [Planctomycetota bacterium]|nr:hypothetical protein [Planctomycetota bacterium]